MFKKISLLLLSCFIAAHSTSAQKAKDLDKVLKDAFWTYCPKEFQIKEVPEKWKNESAVILASSYEYTISKERKGASMWAILKQNIHFRIKLMDKASIEEYSELNFDKNTSTARTFGSTMSYRYVGIKVVKSNGTERELNLSESVSTDYNSSSDNKIAVPDLEPGDILDYFIASKNEYAENMLNYNDIVEMELLESKYPTVFRSIYYVLPRFYNIFDYSYNGAPKFVVDKGPEDVSFKLVDTMRAKEPDILWNYSYRTAPEIRYRISRNDVYDYKVNKKYKIYGYHTDLALVEDFMNKNFKNSTDTLAILNELFLMLRSPIYLNYFSGGAPLYEPLNISRIGRGMSLYVSDYLAKKKIPHEVIVVPRRTVGPFEKQISDDYCDYIVRVKRPKVMYFAVPIPFRLPNEIPYVYEGMEGSVHRFFRGVTYDQMDDETLPISKPENNLTSVRIDLSLNTDDNTKVNVKRNHVAVGNNKQYHQYLIYTNYDYLKSYDLPKYEKHSSVAIGRIVESFKKERAKFEQRQAQDYIERDKKIVESIEAEMDVDVSDYKNLTIKSIGMWPESPNTEYSEEFSIDNLVKKVGPNYLIELGKLIEKQTEVKDEARTRTLDIYMSYPRMYDDEIVFTIPEGYTVEGLEDFNKDVINKTGGFISSAQVKDGKLIVRAKKYFNENYYPAKKWEELLKFLDASVSFYNTKILLRKTN